MNARQLGWVAVAVVAAVMLVRHYPPPMWLVWLVVFYVAWTRVESYR